MTRDPMTHIPIDSPKYLAGVAQGEVLAPAPKETAQVANEHFHRRLAPARGHRAYPVPRPLLRFRGGEEVQILLGPAPKVPVIAEGIAQEIQARFLLPQVHDTGLVPVQGQSQPPLQQLRNILLYRI